MVDINVGQIAEALNEKMDRNLVNTDAIGQAILDKKVEVEALLEQNGYAKFTWKEGNKVTLDGIQYSVHMKELFDYGIKDVAGSIFHNPPLHSSSMPYDQIPVSPVRVDAPAQQYNISIRNYNVSVDLMAGIDGSIKLNSNVQPSTVKAILSALQDTIIDALQVCDKYTNTKRVPIIVDEKGHRITDEQAVSAGKELEQLYIS